MLKHRVIPCLLLHNGGLVKTVRFKSPKYVGDPINAIRIFNEKEVDELMVLDILATREGRQPDYALIEKFASECFMPLCYGGGIKTLEQAKKLFGIGVEKICLQTAALEDLKFISRLVEFFGNQSIMVSIDVKKSLLGKYRVYSCHKQKILSKDPVGFAKRAVDAGAGELLLTSVDRDGTMKGYDLSLIKSVAEAVAVPLIASGGAGGLDDLKKAVGAGASAVAAGSLFVFQGPHRAVLISYPKYAELEELFKGI